MVVKSTFFNNNSICIFTDSSFKITDKEKYVGSICAGACIYWKDVLIDSCYNIIHNVTSQRGELHAILLGIQKSYYYDKFNINLFSDSQTSIFAIRDRIFRWFNDTQNNYSNYLQEDGQISNKDLILDIINNIINNDIHINLYHNKGHVKIYDYKSLCYAKEVFKRSNNIKDNIDDELIKAISIGNDQVDRYTGFMLDNYIYDNTRNHYLNAIYGVYNKDLDLEKYRNLIK